MADMIMITVMASAMNSMGECVAALISDYGCLVYSVGVVDLIILFISADVGAIWSTDIHWLDATSADLYEADSLSLTRCDVVVWLTLAAPDRGVVKLYMFS